jgi:hypothetical protein
VEAQNIHAIGCLSGREVLEWTGVEMALIWGQDDSGTPIDVVWEHRSVPYLQLDVLSMWCTDGACFNLVSQFDDGSGFHGLYAEEVQDETRRRLLREFSESPVFRTRRLEELPIGEIKAISERRDGQGLVIEALVSVGGAVMRLLSGEVYEDLRIVEIDESVLVQVNGGKP